MTKEEVLQKVNDFCTEKQYTSATLTNAFKDKFADHFQKANPEGDINDEAVLGNLHFALKTAFSSASEIATVKVNEFTSKENDYKTQIEELRKKIPSPQGAPPPNKVELPEEVKNQLAELEAFKNKQARQDKFKNVLALAKEEISQDLHSSFETFAKDFEVDLEKEDKAQADALVERYQAIMRPTYGSIKPLKPQQTQKQDKEILENLPKVKVQ